MENYNGLKANSFYVILSGFFKFDKEKLDTHKLFEQYHHWKHRIFGGDYASTFSYLNHNYYDTYLNNAFPEIRKEKEFEGKYPHQLLNHLTIKDLQSNRPLKITIKGVSFPFTIEYVDLYLYPSNIGLFSFKCLLNRDDSKMADISDFTNSIRNLTSVIEFEAKKEQFTIKQYIETKLIQNIPYESNWDLFNPQLKSYIQIDLKNEIPENEIDFLLYDIGNVSPLGSASGIGNFAPHATYYQHQMANNKLSVFQNWTALSLFDTFTRISKNFPDPYKSWEYDYFNIYIHCLFIKFYMYLTNSAISDVTIVDNKTEKLRDGFIEFVNDYYHSHVSYKFLPDLIKDKLIYSLEIHAEIEKMETKIKRINEHAQEKRQKTMNKVLFTITLLSVFSLIHDVSNYAVKMGASPQQIFPYGSIIIGFIIVTSLLVYFRLSRKK